MARTPVAVGLTLCDTVIVEAMTHKVSLIGCLTDMVVDELPGFAEPFSAVAFLSGAQGTIDLDLVIEEPITSAPVDVRHLRIYSPGPISVVYCHFRLKDVTFPRPGTYSFTLYGNGELIALRRARVTR